MRAGPLSDDAVIDLLNRRFVPVYAVNEEHREKGSAPAEEKKECRRIYLEALEAKLSTGTVHAYVIDTAGHPVDSLHVAEAAKTEKLLDMLRRNAKKLEAPEGEPLSAPRPQSRPPEAPASSLVVHVLSRADSRGSWAEFPAEDWIVLAAEEARKLLPLEAPRPGVEWAVDRAVSARLLERFYPQTENNDLSRAAFERLELRARVLSVDGRRLRARLDGALSRGHDFYPGRPDGRRVEAEVAGLLEVDLEERRVLSLTLATGKALYGKSGFAAALRSVR